MIEASPLPAIAEIVRIPAPAPAPQALAHDGEALWVGSWETSRIYGFDPVDGHVFEQTAAPGKPIGATTLGDEIRFVISAPDDDDRTIRRFVPGHGFKSSDVLACPASTGSFLAYDGTDLWLSQRYEKRVLRLDRHGVPTRTIDIGEEIIGLAWSGERLYFSLWLGSKTGRCRIGYIVPAEATPALTIVATVPFVGVSLARDGERFWTNDFKSDAIVAFAIQQPASAGSGGIGGHAAPIFQQPASAGSGGIGGHAAPIFQQPANAGLGGIGGHAAPIST